MKNTGCILFFTVYPKLLVMPLKNIFCDGIPVFYTILETLAALIKQQALP